MIQRILSACALAVMAVACGSGGDGSGSSVSMGNESVGSSSDRPGYGSDKPGSSGEKPPGWKESPGGGGDRVPASASSLCTSVCALYGEYPCLADEDDVPFSSEAGCVASCVAEMVPEYLGPDADICIAWIVNMLRSCEPYCDSREGFQLGNYSCFAMLPSAPESCETSIGDWGDDGWGDDDWDCCSM